jgi:hypothetical protein
MNTTQRSIWQRLARVVIASVALWLFATISLFVYLDRTTRETMLQADAIMIPLVGVSTLLGGVLLVGNLALAATVWLQDRRRAATSRRGG